MELRSYDRDTSTPLRVVVLTCAGLGLETAVALEDVPGVEIVAVINSPHRPLSFRRKLRKVWRACGLPGLLQLAAGRVLRGIGAGRGSAKDTAAIPRCAVIDVADLHAGASLDLLRELAPDLGIVDGTYILQPQLFRLPRFGCVNIHCGRVPDYRGSPPAFWEIFDGTDRVGITIHVVTQALDEGPVLLEREFPVDIAPAGDPMRYITKYWRDVLRPNALEMLRTVVAGVRDDSVRPVPQRTTAAPTRKTPTAREVAELRRRVSARRRQSERR